MYLQQISPVVMSTIVSEFNYRKSPATKVIENGVRNGSFDFTDIRDNRDNTVKYTVYCYPDGYRVRRFMLTSGNAYGEAFAYPMKFPYQLGRNTHTGEWPAFKTINEVVNYINNYMNKIAA